MDSPTPASIAGARSRLLALALAIAATLIAASSASAAGTVSYTKSTWGAASVTEDSLGTRITTVTPPAGLFYRATLDPSRTYRVTIVGENLGTPWTLRVTRDSAPPAYRSAPNGTQVIQVEDTRQLELLFYTSQSGGYRVKSLVIEDCTGTCLTDDDLKAQILAETPGLDADIAAGRRWEASKKVLAWVAPRVAWAKDSRSLIDTTGLSASQLYYGYFAVNRGGAYCGGASDFLREVLELFGIDSFRFDFGTSTADLTHSTVIVALPESGGGTTYRNVDPTFNMTFELRRAARPPTTYELWELWRANELGEVERREGPLGERRILTAPDGAGGFTTARCADTPSEGACSLNAYLAAFAAVFQRNGLTADFAGYVELQGARELWEAGPNQNPQTFVDTHTTFRNAVANDDDSVHVAPLPLAPRSTGAPVLSGSAMVGSTLSTSNGSWSSETAIQGYTYRWNRCLSDGSACSPIAGATASSYTATADDLDRRLRVDVRARNVNGESDPASATSAVVGPRTGPSNVSPPGVTGTPRDGELLTANPGTWSNAESYAYQWQRCASDGTSCTDVDGRTQTTYRLDAADVGSRIAVRVTASNPSGSDAVTSTPTAVVTGTPPVNVNPPGLTGNAVDGDVLYSTSSFWEGTRPFTWSYQWFRCASDGSACAEIAGATSDRIRLSSADIGKRLKMRLTATSPWGTGSAFTPLSDVAVGAPPSNVNPPGLTGNAVDGDVIYSTSSFWNGTRPFTWSYQWFRCAADGSACAEIAGATSDRIRLSATDVGKRLKMRLTATSSWGSGSAFTPLSTTVTGAPPSNAAAPTLGGTATDGEVLFAASVGTWNGTRPFTWGYQWTRCASDGSGCADIAGATNDRIRLSAADVGKRLKLRVIVTSEWGSGSAFTALSGTVAGVAPSNTTPPAIAGTAQVGKVVEATTRGAWAGTTPLSYTYQWYRCSTGGTGCASISGATALSYRIASKDRGFVLKLRVTATNGFGAANADSNLTAVVQ